MKWKILLTLLMLCSAFACRQKKIEATTEIARVKVARISFEKTIFPIRSSGLVVSAREVKLSFKTGGIIESIYVNEGATVKKGYLLAALDLSEIKAQVTQTVNGYNKALRDYNRSKNLFADSVATLEQLQNAETAMNIAKANMEIANFNMNHSKIFAPDNGVILKQIVESNEIIAPGYPVFLFGITGKQWKIKTGLSDRDFIRITVGDTAKVTLDAYPGINLNAVVSQLGESANPLTGTYEVELDLIPANIRLASGFIANLEIFPSHAEAYYRLPIEAVVGAEGQTGYIYTITDSSTAKKIKINIAGFIGSMITVSSELGNIKEVVTDGASYLTDGEHVVVIK